MMNERLRLAKQLLTDDGVIFVSIDDNEQAYLKVLMDEIFGERNSLGVITWMKKRKGSFLTQKVISLTEYILVYSKNPNAKLYGGEADEDESQPIIKRTNTYNVLNFAPGIIETKLKDGIYPKGSYGEGAIPIELLDDLVIENGKNTHKVRMKAPFTWSQDFLDDELSKGTKLVINTINLQVRAFRKSDNFKGYPSYIVGVNIKGTNEDAYEDLEKIFGVKKIFDYSKPVNLIKELIKASTHFKKNAIVLDFFAGSGTTGQAVMEVNEEDGGKRKFILVTNNENNIGTSITRERLYRVINGIGSSGEKIDWSYSKDLVSLVNNNVRIFGIQSHNLKMDDFDKAKELVNISTKQFVLLNNEYKTKNDFDIYNELASLNPYIKEVETNDSN